MPFIVPYSVDMYSSLPIPTLSCTLLLTTPLLLSSFLASYVFGEPVEGTATIKFTLEARARRESFDFRTITAKLVSV